MLMKQLYSQHCAELWEYRKKVRQQAYHLLTLHVTVKGICDDLYLKFYDYLFSKLQPALL